MDKFKLLCKLNEEKYEYNINATSPNILMYSMYDYFDEFDLFNKYILLDSFGYIDEDGNFDEISYEIDMEKEKRVFIEELIEWAGSGEYCLVGNSFCEPAIMRVDGLLLKELNNVKFPIKFDEEFFKNTNEYILEWKKSKGYKYVYFISFIHDKRKQGMIEYNIDTVVYANNKINNVLNTLYKDKGIFIGEHGVLGSNYISEEVEEFNIDRLENYKFIKYDEIHLD